MNFKKLTDAAKKAVDKRGGTDALKGDLSELQKIAKGQGTPQEKAKRAAQALKKPGAQGTTPPETPAGT
ncbi:MAG: hypothetical protein JWP18_2336, partial [Solirubrobacterales bacterium]|nr:hypothetical protein [Solirubrobacterales bacterium]